MEDDLVLKGLDIIEETLAEAEKHFGVYGKGDGNMDEIRVGTVDFGFMGKTHTYGYKTIALYYSSLPFIIKLVGVCDAATPGR